MVEKLLPRTGVLLHIGSTHDSGDLPSVADWALAFTDARPVTIDGCAAALSTLGAVTVEIGELSGNPRDFYDRSVRITARPSGSDARYELGLSQSMRGPDDPETITTTCGCTLVAPRATFAAKLAAWHAVRDALAPLGCIDRTLAWRPAAIVDDAEAAGEAALAARLRADITAALVAEAATCRHVSLMSARADIDAVLAAYVDPQDIRSVTFDDCRLRALPAAFASRFPNVETLSWVDDDADAAALRGIQLAKLDRLHLRGPRVQRVTRADLAGLRSLAELFLANNPLEELDEDIIAACPNLRRVVIANTPVAREPPMMELLRARWPGVRWE